MLKTREISAATNQTRQAKRNQNEAWPMKKEKSASKVE
uniref:Uncharacterized protein n=1 Tax=Tetranychus urticae TaxID=32264 RepID=T1KS44_TETUR